MEKRLVDDLSSDEQSKRRSDCIEADFYSCEAAVKRLNEYLDHQLTPEEKVVVLRHLEICRPCFRRFTFEQTLVISLRQKVSVMVIPPPLRAKLQGLLRDRDV
jgi:anti-sigma factor (TIGR02949 family)